MNQVCWSECGLCCENMDIVLGPDEYDYMDGAGNDLQPIEPEIPGVDGNWVQPNGVLNYALIALYYQDEAARQFDSEDQRRAAEKNELAAKVVVEGSRLYGMKGACANLDLVTRQCVDYMRRPYACQAYEVGAKDCLDSRSEAGLDNGTPVFIRSS